MEVAVKNILGKETGRTVTLPEGIFAVEPNDHAIYEDVRQIQANGRQGTHKSKERGEVSGSTKKPFRQKGTGGARAGHKRSPLWRHGGRIFGPRPRDYSFKLNKKIKRLARRGALTYKNRENAIIVVENFNFAAPKTKDFLKVMSALNVSSNKVLMVIAEESQNVYLSGRNVPRTNIVRAADLNTVDILDADRLVIVEGAVAIITEQLG